MGKGSNQPGGRTTPRQQGAAGAPVHSASDVQREIQNLIDLLKRNNLTELEWECAAYRVRLRHELEPKAASPMVLETAKTVTASPTEPVHAPAHPDTTGLVTITSPIVGTFYRSPSPDADPYVEEGDMVKKGQVLCIVEAMKLMNEIESEVDGRVVKILVESSKPVEYGHPLFLIEPASGA